MTDAFTFTPVPVRARRDGWTPARQHALIAALRETRCVVAACRAIGLSWQSAYQLRARPDATSFAAAWDAALATSLAPMEGRAMHGIATPVVYRGHRIGERRRYDHRLAMYLLSIRRPELYGTQACPREGPDALDEMFADLDEGLFDDAAEATPPETAGPAILATVARNSSTSAPRRPSTEAPRRYAAPLAEPAGPSRTRLFPTGPPKHRPTPRLHRRRAAIGSTHAHRRHPTLRPRQHLRPYPARRDSLNARL